jgi:hypothetical protein
VRRPWSIATAASLLILAGCGSGPRPMGLAVMNLSDEDLEVRRVEAPEFAYRPPVGVMSGNGRSSARSSRVVRSAPREVIVEVAGRPPETIKVPPLPTGATEEVDLMVVYTRSRRWVARWEVPSEPDAAGVAAAPRLHPDDADPRYRLHLALMKAAEDGDVRGVDDLLKKGAPLRWETSRDTPLAMAARRNRVTVVERLLQIGDAAFPLSEIEDAVVLAAAGSNQDIACLRLLIAHFAARLGAEGRARALHAAAESHRMDPENRIIPAGPAIRFLVDEAKFDVNTPLTPAGHTALDLASNDVERFRDKSLVEFLEAHGGRRGVHAN